MSQSMKLVLGKLHGFLVACLLCEHSELGIYILNKTGVFKAQAFKSVWSVINFI